MKKSFLTLFIIVITLSLFAKDPIRITTWNIEHLGSYGRGLGGIGSGSLGFRTDAQLQDIASLIKDTLQSDIVAIQEVALNNYVYGIKINDKLEKLVEYLGEDWEYVIGSTGGTEEIGYLNRNMQEAQAEKYMPSNDHGELAIWRKTYSDHFPITFEVKILKDNDVD